jgi:membrane-bound lytic murein transglycosylase MltF
VILSRPVRLCALALCLIAPSAPSEPAPVLPAEPITRTDEAEIAALAHPLQNKPWRGDLEGMRARRRVRVLVPHSRTHFFLDRGRELGIDADFARQLELHLNKGVRRAYERVSVVLLPVARDRLIQGLLDGTGDVAMGSLTITPERAKLVDFAAPVLTGVREVVVTGPAAPALASLEDLGGRPLHVRVSSSYHEHVLELNQRLAAQGRPPIELVAINESLEDEDLLEMVSSGLLPYAVVDRYKAEFWAGVLPGLRMRDDLVVHAGSDIAWALRKDSPKLRAALDRFVATCRAGTRTGNVVLGRYLRSSEHVKNALGQTERERFEQMVALFREHAARYRFDYLMVMAQGYQESGLDQSRKSPRGAVGVMQLLPSTAASLAIDGVERDAARNIEAGAKYLRLLVDRYLDEPGIDAENRLLMAFAAYNAGPTNLRKFRLLARRSQLDPDVWFDNVEIAASRIAGRETVQYVRNILKYYTAYRLAQERELEKRDQRGRMQRTDS